MYYRTRLYLAAEWDGDKDLIDQIRYWKDHDFYSLDFSDAHDLMQSRDTSLPCSIKHSLAQRMSGSKTFLLVVGDKTKTVTKGKCQFCKNYYSSLDWCSSGNSVNNKSFIEYECEKALRDGLRIVVLYNSYKVDREKCPAIVRYEGLHIAAYHYENYTKKWNYQDIKNAING